MKTLFLSHEIDQNTPLYGGKQGLIQVQISGSIAKGGHSNSLHLAFPAHTGTHLDFPKHFCEDGKTQSDYPADFWTFKKVVLYVGTPESWIAEKIIPDPKTDLFLIRTGFESCRGTSKYVEAQPPVPSGFADRLIEQYSGLRAFGLDYISLSSIQNRELGREVHREFLCKHKLVVIEDMHLQNLTLAPSEVVVLPLRVSQADGVPCSVLARLGQNV